MKPKPTFRTMTRREFMQLVAMAGGAAFIAGCAPAAPTATPTPLPDLPTPTTKPTEKPVVVPTAVPTTASTATTAPKPTEDRSKYGGIFRASIVGEVPSLSDAVAGWVDWWLISYVLYNRPYDFDENQQIFADLAQDFPQVSSDGLIYRVMLKKGIKFHNGRDVKAEDFKYSIDRNFAATVTSSGPGFLNVLKGAAEIMALPKPPDTVDLPGVKVLDDYTVEFTLVKPSTSFPLALTREFANLQPKQESLAAKEKWGTQVIIGTGPFKFKEWKIGEKITFERNPNYHKQGLPYYDGLEVYLSLDPQAAQLSFEKRELDFIKDVAVEYAKKLQTDPVFKNDVRFSEASIIHYVDIAQNTEPFKDIRMRQAFSMAVDKQATVSTSGGSKVAWDGLLTPSLLQYDPEFKTKFPYNPTEAAKIVKELYPNGVKVKFWGYNANFMEIIQEDLKKVGIEAELVTTDFGIALNDLKSGTIQLSQRGWGYDFPDGQELFSERFGNCDPNDKGRWLSHGDCDAKINDMLAQIDTLVISSPERTTLIRKLQEYILNEKIMFLVVDHTLNLDLYAQYLKDCPTGAIIPFPIVEKAWNDKAAQEKLNGVKPQG